DTSHPPLGVAFAGTELTVELAATVGAASQWFSDPNGWFYWGGGTEIVPELLPPPPLSLPAPPPPLPPSDRPPLAADPAFPFALVDDEESDPADIPEGETRRLTMAREAVSVNILEVPIAFPPDDQKDQGRGAVSILMPELPAIVPPVIVPPVIVPPVFESSSTAVPENPNPLVKIDPQKLGWGIGQYAIQTDWWQNRQLTGRGVSIALLSTGVLDDHPDLRQAVREQMNFLSELGDIAADIDGIGTQAAVIAAGRGQLVYGVAPEANLLIGLVGQYDREITAARLLEGLRWAISNDADIIALLVDLRDLTEGEKLDWQAAIQEALDRNMILLAPVGNSLERRPEVRYPANLEGVISIGAHDQSGLRSAFSAKSYRLDVLAPGEGLLSSDLRSQPVANLKSTAIATAYTAGLLALVRQWETARGRVQSPADIRELLRSTAAPHKAITQGNDVEYGYGILNPAAILRQLESL
ncbi:MAG: S8 family serine peptidase, partial [Saprospiraceae bacterium]